ncbi:MAG TPA: membrane protein insertion efficiency factor YidD [Burkholderiaceae bacterium]
MQYLLTLLVRGYRLFFSAWIGPVCRYEPSCSAYALGSLERHGALAGSYLTVHRLLRCNPWSCGGHDAVPDNPPALFTRLPGLARSKPSNSPESKASS